MQWSFHYLETEFGKVLEGLTFGKKLNEINLISAQVINNEKLIGNIEKQTIDSWDSGSAGF